MLSLTSSFSDSFNEYNQIKSQLDERKQKKGPFVDKQKRLSIRNLSDFIKQITVEPVTFFYACALILHAPLIQQYIYQRVSEDHGLPTYNDVNTCGTSIEPSDERTYASRKDVQSLTSYIHLGVILSASIPSLFMALLLGAWSDKVGRKVVIFLPVVGGLLDCTCILITMFTRAPLYVLFVGSFINGFCGFFYNHDLSCFLLHSRHHRRERSSSKTRNTRSCCFYQWYDQSCDQWMVDPPSWIQSTVHVHLYFALLRIFIHRVCFT